MQTMPAKECVERVLAFDDELRDGTMEEGHHKSEHESREIRCHFWSLAIMSSASIGRSA